MKILKRGISHNWDIDYHVLRTSALFFCFYVPEHYPQVCLHTAHTRKVKAIRNVSH